ncbi:MAG: hypothetical protein AAF744_03745 [Pseudomonadota bacterium]
MRTILCALGLACASPLSASPDEAVRDFLTGLLNGPKIAAAQNARFEGPCTLTWQEKFVFAPPRHAYTGEVLQDSRVDFSKFGRGRVIANTFVNSISGEEGFFQDRCQTVISDGSDICADFFGAEPGVWEQWTDYDMIVDPEVAPARYSSRKIVAAFAYLGTLCREKD